MPTEEWETIPDPVTETSQQVFGIQYPFPWQRLVIAAVLDAFEQPEPLRQIAVLPTGAGKSLCWMLPAVMIDRLTVGVFPLLSLIADQERRLRELNVPVVCLRGGQSQEERNTIWQKIENSEVKIILANPEILESPAVENRLKALTPAFLVIDETHTVSQWGESFRPACARMSRLVREWAPQAVLALTATAGPHIRQRIKTLLFNDEEPREALANPDRPTIRYGVLPSLSRFHSLEILVKHQKKPLIVFGSTRAEVQNAARILRFRLRSKHIRFYHAGMSVSEKKRIEEWFLNSDNAILCATCAYGMGVDKSNVRTVIHLSPPSSMEAYLQESGRASRDGKGANAWLIWTPEDIKMFKNRRTQSNLKEDQKSNLSFDDITYARYAAMINYASSTNRCRREMLLESLGIEAGDCNGCDVCSKEVWENPPEEKIIQQFFRWNSGHFRKGKAARILIGRNSEEIRSSGLDMTRGFGSLFGWELEDVEVAIDTLIQRGLIRYGKYGLRKDSLILQRQKKS